MTNAEFHIRTAHLTCFAVDTCEDEYQALALSAQRAISEAHSGLGRGARVYTVTDARRCRHTHSRMQRVEN